MRHERTRQQAPWLAGSYLGIGTGLFRFSIRGPLRDAGMFEPRLLCSTLVPENQCGLAMASLCCGPYSAPIQSFQ